MNVPEVCSKLSEAMQEEVDVFFGGGQKPFLDTLPEAEQADFLQATIDKIVQGLSDANAPLGEHIGVSEQNAFLASAQKTHNLRYRSRLQKWASAYDTVDKTSAEDGTLTVQLASIGVKVDDERIQGLQ
jgi:hypothetical protein